ncbi:MAG: TerB family tellurite resistance protein [Bacteroidia bacterium]|nr:TerB family tellurite resistance protein [Bacteroidia bacterium]
MPATSQLKLLVNLAYIDGEVAEREKAYITNIGLANGLTEDQISPLFDQKHEVIIGDDLTPDEKFDYLFRLVQLMKIDERLYQEEIKYCSKVASRLGYDQAVMFELMLNVRNATMNSDEIETLKTLTLKYLKL